MGIKTEYEDAKKKYEILKTKLVEIKANRKMAEKELKTVDAEIEKVCKGKDPQEVLELLEKEIESRQSMVNDKIQEFEQVLNPGETLPTEFDPLKDDIL